MSGDCCVALPRGAMGLSAFCDCGISDLLTYYFSPKFQRNSIQLYITEATVKMNSNPQLKEIMHGF